MVGIRVCRLWSHWLVVWWPNQDKEKVFVKNQRPGGNPWLLGEVIDIAEPASYRVQLSLTRSWIISGRDHGKWISLNLSRVKLLRTVIVRLTLVRWMVHQLHQYMEHHKKSHKIRCHPQHSGDILLLRIAGPLIISAEHIHTLTLVSSFLYLPSFYGRRSVVMSLKWLFIAFLWKYPFARLCTCSVLHVSEW